MRRRVVITLTMVLFLVGCGQSPATPTPSAAPPTPSVAPPTPAATPPESQPSAPDPTFPDITVMPPTTPTPPPSPTPSPSDAELIPIDPGDDAFFQFTAPSGNFYCDMATDGVFCNVLESGSPKCKGDATITVVLDPGKKAKVRCAVGDGGDSWNAAPLPYGHQATVGRFRCEMRESGGTCLDTSTGHGAVMSRKKVAPIG